MCVFVCMPSFENVCVREYVFVLVHALGGHETKAPGILAEGRAAGILSGCNPIGIMPEGSCCTRDRLPAHGHRVAFHHQYVAPLTGLVPPMAHWGHSPNRPGTSYWGNSTNRPGTSYWGHSPCTSLPLKAWFHLHTGATPTRPGTIWCREGSTEESTSAKEGRGA